MSDLTQKTYEAADLAVDRDPLLLRDAVIAALVLHQPKPHPKDQTGTFVVCSSCLAAGVPCSTVRAMASALGVREDGE